MKKMDRILALFLSLLLVLASGCEMLQGLVDTDPAAYSDPVGEETGQAGTERPSEPTRPSVTPADTGTETPSQETPTQEATEAPEPSSEETGDVTEAPGSEETPSETAVPETGETPPETETQAPGPTDVPGTLPEPWVIERDYTPASEANAIGTVAPGNLYEWADYGASVEYDSAVGTVSAYRDGNFYYLFLPPDTSGSVTFTLRGGIRAVSQGTFSGDRVTVPYHGPTYVSAALANGGNVHVILMQSSVPAMHIVLDNVTLETVHWDKNVKHGGNTVLLIDPENPANNIRATGVEFKGRGNSSWNHYEKKGYQVKFSGRTSVLGMEPAKKWCLVPSAGDGSLLRNKVAYELAKASGCFLFTPEAQFVDLWVSGEYRGLYLITEKVEIDKNRLPLSDPQGVLVELDDMFYFEDTYLQSPVSGHFYVMKEAVDETSLDGFYNFFARMTDLETKLVNHAPWETIAPMIDVQSFASLYIMLELMFNVEDLYTSFFFYMDGPSDVIHMGPVWDYDTCGGLYQEDWLGNKVQGYTSPTPTRLNSNIFFLLGAYPEFRDQAFELWLNRFQGPLAQVLNESNAVYNRIKPSADMNYKKYRVLGTTTWKLNTLFPTFEANVLQFQNWLTNRSTFFVPYNFYTSVSYEIVRAGDAEPVPETESGSTEEGSADETGESGTAETESQAPTAPPDPGKPLMIRCTAVVQDTFGLLQSARIALWSTEDGQDDLAWYFGYKDGDTWRVTFDLTDHPGSEMNLHMYGIYRDGSDRYLGQMFYMKPYVPEG